MNQSEHKRQSESAVLRFPTKLLKISIQRKQAKVTHRLLLPLLTLIAVPLPSGVNGFTFAAQTGYLVRIPFRGSLSVPRCFIKLRRSLDTVGFAFSVKRGELVPARSSKLFGV